VVRTGRWRVRRGMLMVVYPVVAVSVWLAVFLAVNWGIGYVIVGVRSMLEQ